jgi:hypothetical protein
MDPKRDSMPAKQFAERSVISSNRPVQQFQVRIARAVRRFFDHSPPPKNRLRIGPENRPRVYRSIAR